MRIFFGSIILDTANDVEDLRRGALSLSRFLLLDATPRSRGCVCSGTFVDVVSGVCNFGLGVKLLCSMCSGDTPDV